jgi:Baseplate J-like protein
MSIDIEVPVQTDPSGILQIALDYLQSIYPGWTPNTASYDYRELAAHAAMAAEFLQLAVQVPEGAITRFVGQVVYQTPPEPAIAATADSVWTLTDATEHTIPAGTNVAVTAPDGSLVGFQTAKEIVKADGGGSTVTEVALVATEPGAIASNLKGPVTLLDSLVEGGAAWVISIALEGETTGGQDAETDEAYTARIVQLATLLKVSIVNVADYAPAARLLVPQIARALAVDEYNPETGLHGVERCVAVASIDTAGQPSTEPVKEVLEAVYERLRERSFLPFVISPTYTAISVDFKGVAAAGATPAIVQALAIEAVERLLSPATWGVPASGDVTSWINTPLVRYQDVVTALNNVEGFDHYTSLRINGGEADVPLAGVAPLPEVGAVTGVVLAP